MLIKLHYCCTLTTHNNKKILLLSRKKKNKKMKEEKSALLIMREVRCSTTQTFKTTQPFQHSTSKQAIMSDSASAAKRAAERRRKKYCEESGKMSVVSGQVVGVVKESEGSSDGVERKTRRRKRQRPSFMTKKYDVESKPEDQGKIRTAKGNKIPDTTSTTIDGGDEDDGEASKGDKASNDSLQTMKRM